MIDIHAHILPGIDDGAVDIYETLEMAEMAVVSGVRAIVATPHCNIPGIYENYFGKAYIEAYTKAKEAIEKERIPLKLLPGMEAFGTYNLSNLLVEKKIMPLNQSRYVLIEFSFDEEPEFATKVLDDVAAIGAWPIVAHAERYYFIQDNPRIAHGWKQKGYIMQANKSSYKGSFGMRAKHTVEYLTKNNLISVIASDAHGVEMRTPHLESCFKEIEEKYSKEIATQLLKENPEQICKNIRIRDNVL